MLHVDVYNRHYLGFRNKSSVFFKYACFFIAILSLLSFTSLPSYFHLLLNIGFPESVNTRFIWIIYHCVVFPNFCRFLFMVTILYCKVLSTPIAYSFCQFTNLPQIKLYLSNFTSQILASFLFLNGALDY